MFALVAIFTVFYWLTGAAPHHAKTLAVIALLLTLMALGAFKFLGVGGGG